MRKPLSLVMLVLAGCGGALGGGGGGGTGSASGSDSAEAAVRGYFSALGAGNEVTAISYLPSEEVMAAAFDCGSSGGMIAELNEWRDDTRRDAKKSRAAGISVTVLEVKAQGAPEIIRRGQSQKGCTAKQDLTFGEYDVRFRVTMNGQSDEDDSDIVAIKVGGGWFAIPD